jgi:hypothetical protein
MVRIERTRVLGEHSDVRLAGIPHRFLLPASIWCLALVICPAFSICIELEKAPCIAARFATGSYAISNSVGAVFGIFSA